MLDLAMTFLVSKLSVFFPAYNEERNISKTVDSAVKVLEKTAKEWEIIIVNDGSTDKTGEVSDELSKKDKRIKVINQSNEGYGGALSTGFYNSKYPWIAFTDSDGQFDFAEITKFIKTQESTDADLVIGYYLGRKVSFEKILTSKIWEVLVFLLFGLKVRDIDCGFKLIKKEVIDKIPKLESKRGAFISSELLIKAKQSGFKIVEIGVNHYPRKVGIGTGRNINVIIRSFVDLGKLWIKLNF